MTWTGLSMSHLTMPTETHPLNFSAPKYAVYYIMFFADNFLQALGEEIARKIFPETTIVRPAPMFGFEDRLLHKLAGVNNLFTSNHMQERYWPVHVCLCLTLFKWSHLILLPRQ